MMVQARYRIYTLLISNHSGFKRNCFYFTSTYQGDAHQEKEKAITNIHEQTEEENQLVNAIFNKVMKKEKLKERKPLEEKNQESTTKEKTRLIKKDSTNELNPLKKEKLPNIYENTKMQIKKKSPQEKETMISTVDKNICGLVENTKRNRLTVQEKMKQDHFYKIFFSSKKVKIIKSQNHPIFIHLYKLATDVNYRHHQEKILITNKKIILEREKNHIARIYTSSINNLREFHLFDNFVLLSNRLLKKISFLYSFKNGVIAEVSHTFHYDHVGYPHLAFCMYNINHERRITHGYMDQKVMKESWKIHTNDPKQVKQELEQNDEPKAKDIVGSNNGTDTDKVNEYEWEKGKEKEILCNGDIGTLIRSCFLFKWQCIFNIISKGSKDPKKKPYKYLNVNNIHKIDVYHPFSIRASAGYVLDIPYKNIELENIQEYTKKNQILLLKYHPQSTLFLNYNNSCEGEASEWNQLLKNSKGVFLILDNYNHLENKFTVVNQKYIQLRNDTNHENIYDRIYYINLKNLENKNIGLIAAYSICMYILKVYHFKHIPQSPYVFVP